MSDVKKEAPGGLELIRAFVNSLDPEDCSDQLTSPQALAGWLVGHGLLAKGARATRGDLEQALELREALRTLLLFNNDGGPAPKAGAVLNAVAKAAGMELHFTPEGSSLEPTAAGVPGALGKLLAVIAESMSAGTWERLKACREGTCLWAFYDHSKNHSRTWCSMAVCGNRTKVKAYRKRKVK